jgi:hypothetical protein
MFARTIRSSSGLPAALAVISFLVRGVHAMSLLLARLCGGWRSNRPILIAMIVMASQVGPASLPGSHSPSPMNCREARQWAEAHASTLPRTLDAFARLEGARRRAAFTVISAADRAQLWQEQLTRFQRRTDLTIETRALTAEALAVLGPEAYQPSGEARDAARRVAERLARTFMRDEHRRAFADLGYLARPAEETAAATSVLGFLSPSVAAQPNFYCECSFFAPGNWDCGDLVCSFYWLDMCWKWIGCGPLGIYECDSLCDVE